MILACVICCNAQKHYIGIDIISGVCFETIQLKLSHGFDSHWSAGADVGVDLNPIIKTDNELSNFHNDALKDCDLGIEEVQNKERFLREISIHVEFWPERVFNGPLISFGGHIRDTGRPDMTIGVGYSFLISNGLGADIIYRCGLTETYSTGKLPSDGIKAGIYYVF